MSQILGYDHVHHIYELDVNTILIEASIEIVHQSGCQLTFNVTNLADLDATYVVSDSLFALLGKKLFKLVGSQIVKELFAIFLASSIGADVESHTDIN